MGIGIVLILWAVVGLVVAGIGAAVLGTLSALATRGVKRGRKLVIVAASVFPFLCFGWMGVVWGTQAFVNETYFHRDVGLGDTWTCPLPNGYAVLMIDTPDEGFVYNPKTQRGSAVGEQEDAVAGVRILQISGPYILGGTNSYPGAESKSKALIHSSFWTSGLGRTKLLLITRLSSNVRRT